MAVRRKDSAGERNSASEQDPSYRLQLERNRERRQGTRAVRKLIPLLLFLVVGLLIARTEIPAVDEWWQKTFSPDTWSARHACQQAAINSSPKQEYARVLEPGEVHKTKDGLYVDRLILGEMGDAGTEHAVEYSCYLDSEGKLFKLNRLSSRSKGSVTPENIHDQ